eukprot:16353345-Heterocapsa_arctica.AAC.1
MARAGEVDLQICIRQIQRTLGCSKMTALRHNARGISSMVRYASCIVLFCLDVQSGVGIVLHYARGLLSESAPVVHY